MSTRCPECGAPLGIDAGSRVASCAFCHRAHYVAGPREFLTTFLEPRLSAQDALAGAKRHLRESQVRCTEVELPRLVLVPYWRLQTRLYRWIFGTRLVAPHPGQMEETPRSSMLARDFDHTWPAVSLDTGLSGLSTRPSVLEVKAFDPQALPAGATWLRPEREASKALEQGLDLVTGLLHHDDSRPEAERRVPLQHSLTLIFFPFFEVRHRFRDEGCRRILVDAVGGEVTSSDETCEAESPPGAAWLPPSSGLHFLPLACPDCTFTLDLEVRHEVCRCPNCHRAWEVGESGLGRVTEQVSRAAKDPSARMLPFWVFQGSLSLPGHGELSDMGTLKRLAYEGQVPGPGPGTSEGVPPMEILVPAFECRQPDKLLELAARFSLAGQEWPRADTPASGTCLLSSESAARMIDLCLLRVLSVSPAAQASFASGGCFSSRGARLIWVAFRAEGREWIEPETGAVLQENMLGAW